MARKEQGGVDIFRYDVNVEREFAFTLGGESFDVLPATVRINVMFGSGKDALEFERKVRDILESV